MIIVALILLGLAWGSFINAYVWRLYKQSKSKKTNKYSIVKGRSQCVHCSHQLATKDLIPVISWLSLGGKCRYCHRSISWQYPAVELGTSLLFVVSYIYWPQDFQGATLEIALFGLWLMALVGLIALTVYDIRWMILPNKILTPIFALGATGVVLTFASLGEIQVITDALAAMLVGGGLFYAIFQLSNGRWIGGGDVKLGFVLGLLLGSPDQALLMLFLASLLGSLTVMPLLLLKKVTPKTRIPFGPFLIAGAIIAKFFGADITDWYLQSFIIV